MRAEGEAVCGHSLMEKMILFLSRSQKTAKILNDRDNNVSSENDRKI